MDDLKQGDSVLDSISDLFSFLSFFRVAINLVCTCLVHERDLCDLKRSVGTTITKERGTPPLVPISNRLVSRWLIGWD